MCDSVAFTPVNSLILPKPFTLAPTVKLKPGELRDFLEERAAFYNRPDFIALDPISIPHSYRERQDIEIAGFFAAVLAWGQRVTIVRKCKELMERMDSAPYQYITQHQDGDLKSLEGFKHRTFNTTDTLYFVAFLHWFYHGHRSLEEAFSVEPHDKTVEQGLARFHNLFFSLEAFPERTRKHVATPERKSTCKRLNMYLRWMVRNDRRGVDFGIWTNISPAQLICPCDLHVDRVARKLRLIKRRQTDWLTAVELTDNLRKLDPDDPVKYDFALFGLGIDEGWSKAR